MATWHRDGGAMAAATLGFILAACAMVVWLQADAAGQRGLYASSYTAAGGWAASADRVDAGAAMASAQVAIDKAGIATVVWSKQDAAGEPSIYASRYR